jgi:tRNA (guanine-N(7)-)-methyltransferase
MNIDFKKYPLPKKLRHHTAANLYFPLAELKKRPRYYPPLIDRINWAELFANGEPPDILDVGCGKGKLLLDMAELNPSKNLLGIEVRKVVADWLDGVISEEIIPNVAVLWYSVVNGLNFIESDSMEKILYLFPDPWPKKKHHKRRAFNELVLKEFNRILKPNGQLYLATDVPEVHKYHLELLGKTALLEFDIIDDDEKWGLPVTNKETFCRKKNISFDRIIAVKKNKNN